MIIANKSLVGMNLRATGEDEICSNFSWKWMTTEKCLFVVFSMRREKNAKRKDTQQLFTEWNHHFCLDFIQKTNVKISNGIKATNFEIDENEMTHSAMARYVSINVNDLFYCIRIRLEHKSNSWDFSSKISILKFWNIRPINCHVSNDAKLFDRCLLGAELEAIKFTNLMIWNHLFSFAHRFPIDKIPRRSRLMSKKFMIIEQHQCEKQKRRNKIRAVSIRRILNERIRTRDSGSQCWVKTKMDLTNWWPCT